MFFCDILGLFWKGSPHPPRGFEVIIARVGGGGGFKYIFFDFFSRNIGEMVQFFGPRIFFRWGGKKPPTRKVEDCFGGFQEVRQMVFVVYLLAQKWLWYDLVVLTGKDFFLGGPVWGEECF